MSNITTRIGNTVRHFADTSGWNIVGDIAPLPDVSFGAEAWAIGSVGFSVTPQPFFQLEISNSNTPNAGQILFEGKYLPNWERVYRLDMHGIQVSASLGVSILPETPVTVNVSYGVTGIGSSLPILRHRAQGAPPARDANHNYVAGDPTGFLGLAMGGGLGASAGIPINFVNIGTNANMFMFGSNFVEFCRDISGGDWRSAISRGLSMLVARNHLQFHYSGLKLGVGLNATVGTAYTTIANAEVSASLSVYWVSRLHLFIKHPRDDAEQLRYVYTRHYQPDLRISAPYKVNYRAENVSEWDQAWI